jgi:hypothetical protein
MVVAVLNPAASRSRRVFYVVGLGGLSEEKLILLLGLDECLLEQIGVWQ